MTIDEMIAVLQAAKEGKAIQARGMEYGASWVNAQTPSWSFAEYDYRVKPEPRRWWVVLDKDENVLAFRNTRDEAHKYQRVAYPFADIAEVQELTDTQPE
jgi:hypothetical protein